MKSEKFVVCDIVYIQLHVLVSIEIVVSSPRALNHAGKVGDAHTCQSCDSHLTYLCVSRLRS